MKKLYIFVEGNDDERFFLKIVKPLFMQKYDDVEIFKYAQWKKQKVNNFLNSIKTLEFDFIFTADLDFEPSITQKKKRVIHSFNNLEITDIAIVIREIESWYMAGLDDRIAVSKHLKIFKDTNELIKEDFNQLYQNRYRSRIDFMLELLKLYSVDMAKKKNISFKYFIENYLQKINE